MGLFNVTLRADAELEARNTIYMSAIGKYWQFVDRIGKQAVTRTTQEKTIMRNVDF